MRTRTLFMSDLGRVRSECSTVRYELCFVTIIVISDNFVVLDSVFLFLCIFESGMNRDNINLSIFTLYIFVFRKGVSSKDSANL